MKKFFSKENFVFSTFNSKQKRQSLFVTCMICLFFILSALTFFNAMYAFADVIGSIVSGSADVAIKDLLRSLPIFLTTLMSIWTLVLLHANFRNVDEERRLRSTFKNGIVITAFAGVNIVYILIATLAGKYSSLVEGSPSPIYPLDALLYSLLFVGIGVFAIVYSKKLKEKLPYEVPSRGPVVMRKRFFYCLFVTFWMLIALFSFSTFFIGLFIVDFKHGYAFYAIALLLVYLVNACFLMIWEFFYNELKEENRKTHLLPLAITGLSVSVVVVAVYMIALGLNLDAPSNMGFGVLPVAFSASVNIATLIVVFTPLIVSVVALIKGLILRKK